jgi:hypothetical protein
MPERSKLASIHLASTIWFILCVGYILVIALLQAGVNWWIVFSLSGHGFLIVLVLISFYLFAIYRGISSNQKVKAEHPLTSTMQYAFFYAVAPFLGGLAGCIGMIGADTTNHFISGITLGTLATTFLVWVIVDPVIGLLETLTPTSRKHYLQRQNLAKAERKQKERKRLLAEVTARDESNRGHWQEQLKPQAEKLANLLTTDRKNFRQAEREAAGIGAHAWQIGGLSCMRELHNMAIDICRKKNKSNDIVDYITFWWDGIGSWRNPSFS